MASAVDPSVVPSPHVWQQQIPETLAPGDPMPLLDSVDSASIRMYLAIHKQTLKKMKVNKPLNT